METSTKRHGLTTSELILRLQVTDVLDVEDVAILIKKSESRVRHLVASREIPYYKNEQGQVSFLKPEIEAWRLGSRVPTSNEITQKAVTYTAINRK